MAVKNLNVNIKVKELEQRFFTDKKSFRNWLQRNHAVSPGIWMKFYKKHTAVVSITYNEALDEALCYGWIDSIIKRLDDDAYVRKFTPRINTTKWSEVNKKKVTALIKKGKMTEAGLRKTDGYLKTGKTGWENDKSERIPLIKSDLPGFIKKAFAKNEPAWTNFKKLAPTYQRHYVLWINDAKREETRIKRLEEAIALLKKNKKLGLK